MANRPASVDRCASAAKHIENNSAMNNHEEANSQARGSLSSAGVSGGFWGNRKTSRGLWRGDSSRSSETSMPAPPSGVDPIVHDTPVA